MIPPVAVAVTLIWIAFQRRALRRPTLDATGSHARTVAALGRANRLGREISDEHPGSGQT